MPESSKDAEERALRELEGKNIAHYSVLLGAWIDTRMERDKTLVTLSAAAIGLLVAILTTVGVKHFWEIPFFAISVLSFLATIWISLKIYQLNSDHIEAAIKGSSERDPRLEKYDKLSIAAFVVGAVAALVIGIASASAQLLTKEEKTMSDQESSNNTGKPTTRIDSVNGVAKLHPDTTVTVKKSLNGITNLNPQATQKPTQTQTQTQNQAPSTTTNQNGTARPSSEGAKK